MPSMDLNAVFKENPYIDKEISRARGEEARTSSRKKGTSGSPKYANSYFDACSWASRVHWGNDERTAWGKILVWGEILAWVKILALEIGGANQDHTTLVLEIGATKNALVTCWRNASTAGQIAIYSSVAEKTVTTRPKIALSPRETRLSPCSILELRSFLIWSKSISSNSAGSSGTKSLRGPNSYSNPRNSCQEETSLGPKGWVGPKSQRISFRISSIGGIDSSSTSAGARHFCHQLCREHHQKRKDSRQGLWEVIYRTIWNGPCRHLKNWSGRPGDSEIQSVNQQKQQKQ